MYQFQIIPAIDQKDSVAVVLEEALGLLLLELPDVANAAHAHTGDAHERRREHTRLGAEADKGHVDLVVLRSDRGILGMEDVERRQESGANGGAFEETATIRVYRHSF